ncbi:hypothetical protein HN789_06935 [archaeon]|jgi:hypothetical protein|nr:hypothetical protein [archaeon]MBT4273106.1 hypothetical protein [archaeon]MBT4461087.1 hypothetical protein [archaeon]MBT4858756.1 hypothetical protein [archaeon]MBT5423615.1 hypothetical protein [archaeon]
MKSKGQITIFIIIGLVIITIIGAVSVLRRSNIDITLPSGYASIHSDRLRIKSLVKACGETILKEGLFFLGRQGGYYNLPSDIFEEANYSLPYYYNDHSKVPQNSLLERQIELYFEDHIEKCINDATKFGDRYTYELIDSDAEINENKVQLHLDMPFQIEVSNFKSEINNFTIVNNVRLGHMMNVTKKAIDLVEEYPDRYDYTFILNQDVLISIIPLPNKLDIYVITDPESEKIEFRQYALMFAVQK